MTGATGIMLRLAWRNLWRNYRRTLIMLAAITVGTWSMIFMTALMRGMVDDMVMDGIRSLPGHVQIHHPAFRDDPSVANLLEAPGGALLEVLGGPEVLAWSTRVRVPEVVTAIADAAGAPGARRRDLLAIPLVGGGDLAGMLELDTGRCDGFPADERELAEVLAVLLTLSLGTAA